jgi:hypothetical protein
MKRLLAAVPAAVLICCGLCNATVSVVKNGSFENDGYIGNVQNTKPEYWCSANYDSSKFDASINNDWATNGSFSLTMYSYMYTNFVQNDSATITQSVYLDGAEQLIFDIYLYADYGGWKTDVVTASVLIDDIEVLFIPTDNLWDRWR